MELPNRSHEINADIMIGDTGFSLPMPNMHTLHRTTVSGIEIASG